MLREWAPPSTGFALLPNPTDRERLTKASIATISISGTLVEKLEAIAAAGYEGYGSPNAPFGIAAQKRHWLTKRMPRV